METVGTDSDTRAAYLKLHALDRTDLARSIRACIPGRLVGGLRGPKVLFVIADGALAILGGVEWSGYMKPQQHALDAIIETQEVQAAQINFEVPSYIQKQVKVPVTRLRFVKDRVPSLSVAHVSGQIFTFIPEYQHHLTQSVNALASVLDDDDLFRLAAHSFFPDDQHGDVDEIQILDCGLVDPQPGSRRLFPGKAAFGPKYVGFFELGHISHAEPKLSEPLVEDLWRLQSCIVIVPEGQSRLSEPFKDLRHLTWYDLDRADAALLKFEFADTTWWMTPGLHGAADQSNLESFTPLLQWCNNLLGLNL